MMTPDPAKTLVSRLREIAPHLKPGTLIPRAFEEHATTRQAQRFEQARNELAPVLMKKGNDAAMLAKALASYQPGGGTRTQALTNWLLQAGVNPTVRRQVQDLFQ